MFSCGISNSTTILSFVTHSSSTHYEPCLGTGNLIAAIYPKRSKGMTARFSIGIEEEFQMVDRQTGQLRPCIHTILEKGSSIFGEKIKAEMLQSTVELVSDVFPNITTARKEMQNLRAMLVRLVQEEGLALISAGTHPTALWQNEARSVSDRYA